MKRQYVLAMLFISMTGIAYSFISYNTDLYRILMSAGMLLLFPLLIRVLAAL